MLLNLYFTTIEQQLYWTRECVKSSQSTCAFLRKLWKLEFFSSLFWEFSRFWNSSIEENSSVQFCEFGWKDVRKLKSWTFYIFFFHLKKPSLIIQIYEILTIKWKAKFFFYKKRNLIQEREKNNNLVKTFKSNLFKKISYNFNNFCQSHYRNRIQPLIKIDQFIDINWPPL
jgi:hypothetical protein